MERAPKICMVCGETDRKLLIKKDTWTVYRCTSCGHGYLDPRPSKDEIAELYNKKYCNEHFVEGGKLGTPEFDKRLSLETHRIKFFRGIKKEGKVLDIGCGYGYFLAACRKYGYDVQGLDFSDWAVQHAVKNVGIPVITGELNEVDLPAADFDVITMWHSLEHNPDPENAIIQSKKWLKEDGILIIDVPNHEGTDAQKYWENWNGWDLPYHFHHFTFETLKALLKTCGFCVIKTKNYHSEAVKMNLKRFPVISIFARLIAKMYSGHSVAVVAKLRN